MSSSQQPCRTLENFSPLLYLEGVARAHRFRGEREREKYFYDAGRRVAGIRGMQLGLYDKKIYKCSPVERAKLEAAVYTYRSVNRVVVVLSVRVLRRMVWIAGGEEWLWGIQF